MKTRWFWGGWFSDDLGDDLKDDLGDDLGDDSGDDFSDGLYVVLSCGTCLRHTKKNERWFRRWFRRWFVEWFFKWFAGWFLDDSHEPGRWKINDFWMILKSRFLLGFRFRFLTFFTWKWSVFVCVLAFFFFENVVCRSPKCGEHMHFIWQWQCRDSWMPVRFIKNHRACVCFGIIWWN